MFSFHLWALFCGNFDLPIGAIPINMNVAQGYRQKILCVFVLSHAAAKPCVAMSVVCVATTVGNNRDYSEADGDDDKDTATICPCRCVCVCVCWPGETSLVTSHL